LFVLRFKQIVQFGGTLRFQAFISVLLGLSGAGNCQLGAGERLNQTQRAAKKGRGGLRNDCLVLELILG
jgi:hypothetical protein